MQGYFFFSSDKHKLFKKIDRRKLMHILDQQHFLRKIEGKQRLHEKTVEGR